MDIDTLKQTFDLVKLKHFNSETYKATHVALVKGDKVFVGISRCNPVDQFDRRLGRNIAIGRAFYAWKVDAGIEPNRGGYSAQVLQASTPEELETLLARHVFEVPGFVQLPLAEREASARAGCCGAKGPC